MGVMFDYFRAGDRAAAVTAMGRLGGPLVPGDQGEPPFDGVDAKGIDPAVNLGQLVAMARGRPWSTGTVRTDHLWPAPDSLPPGVGLSAGFPEDSPWVTGPWLEALDEDTRDTLADIDHGRYAALAAEWARIEEHRSSEVEYAEALVPLVAALGGLAARARAAGQRLYCWSSR